MAEVSQQAVRIEGLENLIRAFRVAGNEMDKDLDAALRSSAEPVKQSAQSLAAGGVLKVSAVNWSAMRVGITRHTVYVAPVERGVRGKGRSSRPKLAPRMQTLALNPALDQNVQRVRQEVKDAVRDMGRAWGRV